MALAISKTAQPIYLIHVFKLGLEMYTVAWLDPKSLKMVAKQFWNEKSALAFIRYEFPVAATPAEELNPDVWKIVKVSGVGENV